MVTNDPRSMDDIQDLVEDSGPELVPDDLDVIEQPSSTQVVIPAYNRPAYQPTRSIEATRKARKAAVAVRSKAGPWTKAELRMLLSNRAKQMGWKAIAALLPGRSARACKSQHENLNKNPKRKERIERDDESGDEEGAGRPEWQIPEGVELLTAQPARVFTEVRSALRDSHSSFF